MRQRPGPDINSGAERLLDRLVRQEREGIRLVTAIAGSPRFEDVFELYRASGFLYSSKSAALHPHMAAIEQTYHRLLAPESRIFRFVARFGVVDDAVRIRNAISAFSYTGGTWQGQHLVSREHHEYTGTLAVLIELVQGLHDDGAPHIRLLFRPNNPGASTLFGDVARRLPTHLQALSIVDYGLVPSRAILPDPGVSTDLTVRPLQPMEHELAERFYRRLLHPVELASLELADPLLRAIGVLYDRGRLRRRRRVVVAIDHGEVVGACLLHDCSLGINFSFLENAIEQLRVRPDLPEVQRMRVWNSLAATATADARERGRDVVITLDPGDRDMAVAAGLMAPQPKQYAVLTVTRRGDGYLRSIDCFVDYYRRLLAMEVT
jgi:hypothetical protein